MLFHLRDTKRFEFYFDVVLFDVFQRLYVTSCFFLPYDISTFLQSFRIVKETAWHKLNKSFPWYKWVQSWVHYYKWFDNSVYLTEMHLVISEPWRALTQMFFLNNSYPYVFHSYLSLWIETKDTKLTYKTQVRTH